MHFFAGSQIYPSTVTDIPAYIAACSNLWQIYSIPYWIAGLLPLYGWGAEWSILTSAGILVLASVPGIPILIWVYNCIADRYIKKSNRK